MTDSYNMSMRKFLKQVGVTSQQAIEEVLRTADGKGPFTVKATVTIEQLGMSHEISGEIREGDGA